MKKAKRQKVFDKYGGLCAYTGKPLGDDWQVDHAIPKYYYTVLENDELKDQINHIDNLLPAIKIINHYKRGLTIEGFRNYMMDFHKRLSKLPKKTVVKRTEKRKEYMQMVANLFDITPDNPFVGKFYFETIDTD